MLLIILLVLINSHIAKASITTVALVNCQHEWLRRLDSDADSIRIFSFDFRKAFDSVPHESLSKVKKFRN